MSKQSPLLTSYHLYLIFAPYLPGLEYSDWESHWRPLPDIYKKNLLSAFTVTNRPLQSRLFLRALVVFLNSLPFNLQRTLLEKMKRFRSSKKDLGDSLFKTMLIENHSAEKFFKEVKFERRSFVDGGCASLTYDIDQPVCAEYLPHCLKLLRKRNIVAVFNFLANGQYLLDKKTLELVLSEGHEVGLHGYRHDIDFGNRSISHIQKMLRKAKQSLPIPVKGFRSPALSVSPNLMTVLSGEGFEYDSSIAACHPFHHNNGFAFPYIIPETDIVEMPVALQDNVFFSDLKLTDDEAIGLSRSIVNGILRKGGHAVINLHLYIEKYHEKYHLGLLDWLVEDKINVKRMDDCAIRFREMPGSP